MSTDFRALCAEMSEDEWAALVERAWDTHKGAGYRGEQVMYDCDFDDAVEFMRRELARWGQPPAPPAEGEVAELVAWLHGQDGGLGRRAIYARIADLLERHPAPIPVSKPHPPAAKCDRYGRCWWFDPHNGGSWTYGSFDWTCSHWLPAGALPRPGVPE